MTTGKVKKYYIGISGVTRQVSPRFVRFHNLKNNHVVEIVYIDKNSPAMNAGIQTGDFIVKINNKTIITVDDIYRQLSEYPDKNPLEVEIIRREKKINLKVFPLEK